MDGKLEDGRFTHGWGGTMGFTADFVPSVGVLGDAGDKLYERALQMFSGNPLR